MKQRQVSIELLRIIAMIMVLILHANFMGIGMPTADTIFTSDGIIRTLLQSLCICAVNTFVMISGWFGIRPSIKGFTNFMWQVFYFVGLSYLLSHIFYGTPITPKDVLRLVGLYYGGGWFVASYIGLYILSPILNRFIETSSSRTILYLLIVFYSFEFLWGNTLSVGFVIGGYSTFSFIGIYLLAGSLRKIKYIISSKMALLVFLSCVLLNGILYIATIRLGLNGISPILFNYINPLVIASASCLMVIFANMPALIGKYKSKIILWFSSSCFAAYLLHVGTTYSSNAYFDAIRNIYEGQIWSIGLLWVGMFILFVFLLAVILDQPRKWIWKFFLCPILVKK